MGSGNAEMDVIGPRTRRTEGPLGVGSVSLMNVTWAVSGSFTQPSMSTLLPSTFLALGMQREHEGCSPDLIHGAYGSVMGQTLRFMPT